MPGYIQPWSGIYAERESQIFPQMRQNNVLMTYSGIRSEAKYESLSGYSKNQKSSIE